MKNIQKENRHKTARVLYKNLKYELPNYFCVTKVNLTDHRQQQKFIKHVKIPIKNRVTEWVEATFLQAN